MATELLTAGIQRQSDVEQRGEILYQSRIKVYVEPQRIGDFIALDIDSGDYCVDADELAALRGLRQRQPHARIYFARVGTPIVYEMRGMMPASDQGL